MRYQSVSEAGPISLSVVFWLNGKLPIAFEWIDRWMLHVSQFPVVDSLTRFAMGEANFRVVAAAHHSLLVCLKVPIRQLLIAGEVPS